MAANIIASLNDTPSNEGCQISPKEFAQHFLKRASDRFLSAHSTEELLAIVEHVYGLYSRFQVDETEFLIETKTLSAPSIILALKDRPFIVDSTLELLRSKGLSTESLLHPIINEPGKEKTSVVFATLDRSLPDADLAELQTELSFVLQQVISVTGDFERIGLLAKQATQSSLFKENSDLEEVSSFLKWLLDGNFIFTGFLEWKLAEGSDEWERTNLLGLVGSVPAHRMDSGKEKLLEVLEKELAQLLRAPDSIRFGKIPFKSPVHRASFMEQVTLCTEPGRKYVTFLGLYSSKASAASATEIPIARNRLKNLLEIEQVEPNSYDYKETVSLADSFPKSQLLQSGVEVLSSAVGVVLDVQQHGKTRLLKLSNNNQLFTYLLVVTETENFSRTVNSAIKNKLASALGVASELIEHRMSVSDDSLSRIFYTIPSKKEIDIPELESELQELSRSWDENVSLEIASELGDNLEASKLVNRFSSSIDSALKNYRTPKLAAKDLIALTNLSEESPIAVRVELLDPVKRKIRILVYLKETKLNLSDTVPMLENCGLVVNSERFYKIGNEFALKSVTAIAPAEAFEALQEESQRNNFSLGLVEILSRKSENDQLNKLLTEPGLSIKQIATLRAFQHYIWQLKLFASERVIARALTSYPKLSELLSGYFETKFDPALELSPAQRKSKCKDLAAKIKDSLKEVKRLAHDRVFRAFINSMEACLRTNAFLNDVDYRIALKIDCKQITSMPEPRPAFEVAINSPELEGVHLRAGKVARGGLRWSERTEDYRTEILGLMKTQRVKNSIIIPLGAKGGFVVKKRLSDRAQMFELVKAAYKNFIRSLLELSDNIIEGKVVRDEALIVYDEDDPYFVVAADKGTATFSDVANDISENEFNFWLKDAFASGGSNGYDHKLYGITARGAWEAAKHHFANLGIDPSKTEFTAVGIGDMSGDVFGNGLLQSKKFQLVAAFNHRHIFIDPNPKAEEAYEERLRLFSTPGTQWTDYEEAKISKGGGVFARDEKEIKLSPEACKALGLKEGSALSGEELIRAILKAPVDLLWNGGIGTYVKGKDETNLEVGDPSNDSVRVSAQEIRAKIIAEGGNLGLTQQARVEFSKSGGLINTDAVDNSAGVDLSDHEVNFKIMLSKPVEDGRISQEERNNLLEAEAENFCDKVLLHNKAQNLAIALASARSRRDLNLYSQLIEFFETELNLDRLGETLPSKEALETRLKLHAGLTRPESAVVLAYAKMWVYETALGSGLEKNELLSPMLLSRFPKSLHERFNSDIINHPLKSEIVASSLANYLVDMMGAGFLFRVCEETGKEPLEVIKAFALASSLWAGDGLYREIFSIQTSDNLEQTLLTVEIVSDFLKSYITWILSEGLNLENLSEAKKNLEPINQTLKEFCLEEFAQSSEFETLNFSSLEDSLQNIPAEVRTLVLRSKRAKEVLACLSVESNSGLSLSQNFWLFKSLVEKSGLKAIFEALSSPSDEQPEEKLAKAVLFDSIKRSIKSSLEQTAEKISSESPQIIGKVLNQDFIDSAGLQIESMAKGFAEIRSEAKKIGKKRISAGKLFLFAKELENKLS